MSTMSIADKVKAINQLKKQAKELGLTVMDAPSESVELNQLALGGCKIDGRWGLVYVNFNPETMEARVSKIDVNEDGKSGVAEKFKIESVNWLPFFNEE